MTTTKPLHQVLAEFLGELDVSEASKEQYSKVIHMFFRWVHANCIELHSLSVRHIVDYKSQLNKRNLYTSNSYLSILKILFKWIEKKGYGTDITRGVKKNRGFYGFTKKYLSVDQVSSLLSVTDADSRKMLRDNAIIRLMLSSGIRTIEVVRANIGDIECVNGAYIMKVQRKGKLDKSDFVVITESVYNHIANYLCTRSTGEPSSPLFANVREGSLETRLTTRCVSGLVKYHMHRAGIVDKRISTHSLRHTFGVWLVKEGVSIYDVMGAMGHSSVKSTEIYTKMAQQELKLDNKTGKTIEQILTRAGIR